MSSDRLTRADAIRIYEKVMHDVLGIPDASHPLRVALDRNYQSHHFVVTIS